MGLERFVINCANHTTIDIDLLLIKLQLNKKAKEKKTLFNLSYLNRYLKSNYCFKNRNVNIFPSKRENMLLFI